MFALGLRLLDRRPVLAGALLGCLCYKPHIGALIPVALVAGRHWRAFAAAAGSVTVLVCASVLLFGVEPWLGFVRHALAASGNYGSGRIDLAGMVTPFALARLLGVPVGWASAAQAVVALGMAVIVWRNWRLGRPGPEAAGGRAACLIAATMLAVPVLLLYDLMLAQVALAFLTARRDRPLALVAIAVYAAPMICRAIAGVTDVQTAPLIVAALLALAWIRAARPGPASAEAGL